MIKTMERNTLAASVVLVMSAQAAHAAGVASEVQTTPLDASSASVFGYGQTSFTTQDVDQLIAEHVAKPVAVDSFTPVQMQANLTQADQFKFEAAEIDPASITADFDVLYVDEPTGLIAASTNQSSIESSDIRASQSSYIEFDHLQASASEAPLVAADQNVGTGANQPAVFGQFVDVSNEAQDPEVEALAVQAQQNAGMTSYTAVVNEDSQDLGYIDITDPNLSAQAQYIEVQQVESAQDLGSDAESMSTSELSATAEAPVTEQPEAVPEAAASSSAAGPIVAPQNTVAPTSQPELEVASMPTESMVAEQTAEEALARQEGDATEESNLEEVLTANEKRYSLLKKGDWALNYDANYSYYRDSQIDIATENGSSNITRFRIFEDAQHTLINSFDWQYGLRDNLTLTAGLPIVAKTDLAKDAQTVGLGDISLGARWEPFPLNRERLPLIFNGNVSLKTGDSPYEVNRFSELSTGKGYYSFGGGVSTRKYIDPVVLFASGSLGYGLPASDLNQNLGGGRTLVEVAPNLNAGLALGFAYSLNYDVSLTMSYQQGFSVGSEFTVRERDDNGNLVESVSSSADQTSATMNMALGVRVSPETIVNTTVGFGLTEDSPDVTLGVSFPLDFSGFGRKGR